jgi:hypothetical protein
VAYEYNPESQRFELANPHRVENLFLAAAALISLVCAAVALLHGRDAVASGTVGTALLPVLIAVALLAFGLSCTVRMLRQLRFFFGRNQPESLAPTLPADVVGSSPQAEALRETVRQNAISYKVPSGAIDNLLYSLARDLLFSPGRTQRLAQAEFHNALALAFLLLCFLGALAGVQSAVVSAWIGGIYFLLTDLLVVLPLRRTALAGRRLSMAWIIGFIVASAIVPVLLPRVVGGAAMPLRGLVQFTPVCLVILLSALAASALLLQSAIAQSVRPNQIAMAQTLRTLSMNAPPEQIFLEFDREMQRGWVETVPNRAYIRIRPRLEGVRGAFQGHALEETQPLPQDNQPLTLARCLGSPVYRWLVALDCYGLLATAVGGAMLVDAALRAQHFGALLMGGSLLLIARFAFVGGNLLWRRFEFTSRIYWLEVHGNFQTAQTSTGQFLQDRVKTQKDIVNVEDMTLRVWAAEIDSVSFGPDLERSLLSIRGLPVEAERLADQLASFGARQASIVAPTAETDVQRLALLQKLNPPSAESVPPLPAAATPPAMAAQAAVPVAAAAVTVAAAAAGARFCTQCGAGLAQAARFCGQCGAAAAVA